jgi:hypothetical protein
MAAIGLAFLYATGIIYCVELGLALIGVRWSVWNVTAISAIVACGVLWLAAGGWRLATPASAPPSAILQPPARLTLIDLATLVTLAAYALYATVARVWEWDFWAIWGLKARVFFEAGTIDWRFLESRWNDFSHPDYPLLLPLNYVYMALLGGGWNDRWLGLVTVAFGAAFLLIVRGLAAREARPLIASAIAFAATAFALSGFIGLAETPLMAFAGAAILFIRRAILFDDSSAMRHGALLAGFAASTKNEGTALLVTIVIALAISKRRLVMRLWPAFAVAAPWWIIRAIHRFPTDLARGSFASRALARAGAIRPIAALLVQTLNARWMWVAILTALLVVPHALRARERFVFLVFAIQIAIYIAIYFGTPFEVEWQIETSWPRLTAQLATPVLVVVMLMLARTFAPEDDLAHAEARPDH